MKIFALLTLFVVACPSATASAAPTAAAPGSVSPADQRAAYQAVMSLAKEGPLDADNRRRLFYQLCSELRGCARDCARELSACARSETDPSSRAVLVASCAPDYRQRRDQGEALHPDAWLKERLVRFLDAVSGTLAAAERRSFEDARTQVRLLSR